MNSGSWYWPDVSDLDGAKDATKYGMWCAILVAALTAGLSVLTIMGMGIRAISAYALVEALVFAGIALPINRNTKSRLHRSIAAGEAALKAGTECRCEKVFCFF
jgi:hypothetical protein